jgi:hypothetical protein
MSRPSFSDLSRQLKRSITKIAHLKKITIARYGVDAWEEMYYDQIYEVSKEMKNLESIDDEER